MPARSRPTQHAAALREIYAAEGSDWFWWYGPDFSTENDALFDSFSASICAMFTPSAARSRRRRWIVPISGRRAAPLYSVPERLISPSLDGGESFFDWLGAGSYTPGRRAGRDVSRASG